MIAALISAVFAVAASSPQTCIEPSSDRITAGELAKAIPAFASLPSDRVLTYAPQPGFVRTITAVDLLQWLPEGQEDRAANTCIAWRMTMPDSRAFENTMRKELPSNATLAVLEISRFAVPANGTIHFPWSGLSANSTSEPSLWRGYIEYAPGAKFPVWARVDIRVRQQRIIAVNDIAPGTEL